MKKALLSSILIFTFASYALYTRVLGTNIPVVLSPEPNKPKTTLLLPTYTPTTPPPNNTPPAPVPAPIPKPTPNPTPLPTPLPIPVPPPTPSPVVNTGKYKNGSYTGPVVDAYYGNVQVKVVISGGKITDVQFLDYPQDRQTSQRINSRAMPYLISEAITAQDANVDGVSGASFTSAAYQKSLASALTQAKI